MSMSDQADTSRFLQFAIHSNVMSGVAALLLDVLLITFIKFQSQLLCSTANVYLVYDKRRAVSPTRSCLSGLAGGPVGPRQLAHLLSALIAIVTISVILLGFSIDGKTVDIYEPTEYNSLVKIDTGQPADIDYDKEFERRNSNVFISKRLAAMSDSYVCQRNNYTDTEVFAHVYKDTKLNDEMVNRLTKLTGAECVTTPEFNRSLVVRHYRLGPQVEPVRCVLDEIDPRYSDNKNRTGTAGYTISECDFDLGGLQCFRGDRTACAAVGKQDETSSTYIYLVPDIIHPSDHGLVQIDGGHTLQQEVKLALNVAFLSVAGFTGGVANLANIAVTHVSYNQTLVKRIKKGQQVSEVDLRLAVPSLAVVATISLMLTIISVWLWLEVVYRNGRWGYNKFSTVSDMLEIAKDSAGGIGGRFRRAQEVHSYVGISRSNPNVVVVGQYDKGECTDSTWAEDEIDGFCSMHGKEVLATRDDGEYKAELGI